MRWGKGINSNDNNLLNDVILYNLDNLMGNYFLLFCCALLLGAFFSVITKKLTIPAAATAFCIGCLVLFAAGGKGLLVLCLFFVFSVLATSHKKGYKAKLQGLEMHEETRSAEQVLANGGVAGLLALLCLIDIDHADLYQVMIAGSVASALADTLSSELGTLYGNRFYNILTFKRGIRGMDGVISIEGTVIGMVGAVFIAFAFAGVSKTALFISIAGILGNLLDSILGASLERRRYLGNNGVNFLNTLFAALVVLSFFC